MPFIAKYIAVPSLELKKCPLFATLFALAQLMSSCACEIHTLYNL